MNTKPSIRFFELSDWERVKEIYQLGIDTGNATFETRVPGFEAWMMKFHPHLLWVAIIDGKVVGWAGLQPVSAREAYGGVVEVTIYVHPEFGGNGVGSLLMKHLVRESEAAGKWTLYASIFPENAASIRLHEAAGFRKIGYREKIARLNGKWRNTVLYERRSKITGI